MEITDPAIVAAAELSHRYITDRFLPDKAIDLIDEAAAKIKIEIDSKPEVMDKLERRMIQLKIEREAMKKEKDEASQKRLQLIEEELGSLEREYADLEEVLEEPRRPAPRAPSRSARKSTRCRIQIEELQAQGRLQQGGRAAVRQAALAGSGSSTKPEANGAVLGRAARPPTGCCAPMSAPRKSRKWSAVPRAFPWPR